MDVMVVRVDKILSELGFGSRSEIKKYAKAGKIRINDRVIKKADEKVDSERDKLYFEGRQVVVEEFETYVLYKPAGYVCATKDNVHKTVMELIDSDRKNIVPVGRLDLDTEGLLILTNDGVLNHRLVSPASHVDKVYFTELKHPLKLSDIEAFAEGLDLGDFISKPAKLEICENEGKFTARVTISEGKFHQIKRMFEAVDNEVVYLKRLSMGRLVLDENLELGEVRELTEDEIDELCE